MIDLEESFNFTNKLAHPTNPHIAVYRFVDRRQADAFTEMLVEAQIDFEAQEDGEHPRRPIYIGVARRYEKQCDRFNYLAMGRYHEKFIPSPAIRWLVIAISLLAIGLAVAGALSETTR